MEQKARSITRIFTRGDWHSPEASTLPTQVGSLFTAHFKLGKTQRESEGCKVVKWARVFWNATHSGAASTASALRQLAGAKAKKIEAAIRRDRLANWRCCIGATASDKFWQPKPTKLAYRWVKGLEGWQHSTVAKASWNDKVQVEDGSEEVENSSMASPAAVQVCGMMGSNFPPAARRVVTTSFRCLTRR